jgi:hypothetical protein
MAKIDNMDESLDKSLAELDALADEMLAKSVKEEAPKEEAPKDVKPDEVSAEVPEEEPKEKEAPKEEAPKEEEKEPKEKEEEVEKSETPCSVCGKIHKGECKKANVTEKSEEGKDPNGDDLEQKEYFDGKEGKKSLAEELKGNEAIQKALDVSDFLSEWTRIQTAELDDFRSHMEKSLGASTKTAEVLAKSFGAIMKSQESLAKSLADLADRLEVVERTPVGRKAQVNVVEKSFNHSAVLSGEGKGQELSKAEKLTKLSDMAMQGKAGVTINDVVSYESTGFLRPEVEAMLS